MEPIDYNFELLNDCQKQAYEFCMNESDNLFCTGQAGSGKTIVLQCAANMLRSRHSTEPGSIAVTASTRIATFIVSSTTLHRFVGTGIEEDDLNIIIRRARKNSEGQRSVKVLFIEEISILLGVYFNNLSSMAKAIRGNDRPFRGIRVLMFGDFLQLPPVSRFGVRSKRVFEIDAWADLNPMAIELRVSMRQSDLEFTNALNSIRLGVCTDEVEAYMKSLDRPLDLAMYSPVKLFARRNAALEHNLERLDSIEGEEHVYESIDHGLESTLSQCPAEKKLRLKVGAQVMLIRNADDDLVNGTLGKVKGFEFNDKLQIKVPIVEFKRARPGIVGDDGPTLCILRTQWMMIDPTRDVVASRSQVPLILAWALTIHKSQGCSISHISVDMLGIFESGQAYVALSRARDPRNTEVKNFKKSCVKVDEKCLRFHCWIRAHENSLESTMGRGDEELPKYTEGDDPPEYGASSSATGIASSTQ